MSATKQKLKQTITKIQFLSAKEKKGWFLIMEALDEKTLDELYKQFKKANTAEMEFLMELVYKSSLDKKVFDRLNKNIKKYLKTQMNESGKAT